MDMGRIIISIVITGLGIACIYLIIMCIYTIIASGKMSVEKKKADSRQRKLDKADGVTRFSAVEHVEGLGLVEKASCAVVLSPPNLVISCTGKEYTLPLKRITYVDYLTDVEKIRYLQSSMAKGIAGGALFGVSGAVIGSAPKTKVVNETTGYAVIGYRDEAGKEKTIILRSPAKPHVCYWMVCELKSRIQTTVEKVTL